MSNDSHDAVAVVITLRGASQPAERKKRKCAFWLALVWCFLACTRVWPWVSRSEKAVSRLEKNKLLDNSVSFVLLLLLSLLLLLA